MTARRSCTGRRGPPRASALALALWLAFAWEPRGADQRAAEAAEAPPRATIAFVELPDFTAAGEEFAVVVRYALAPGLSARLNVEIKNLRHVVLLVARREASGTGTFRATFRAPSERQRLLVAIWVGTDWRQPLSRIRTSAPIDVVSPALAARRRATVKAHRGAAEQFLRKMGPRPDDRYAIALLKDAALPGHDPKLADEMADLLHKRGHEVTLIDADLLVNRQAITADRFDMLFLPACHTLPGEAGPVIKHYCDKGGDITALGTPAFRTVLAKAGDRWVSRDGWRKLLAELPARHVILDFENEDLRRWERHTNAPKAPFTRELVPGRKGRALHIDIPTMRGWDGLASPKLPSPFPEGHSLTCFWARGLGPTRKLSFEWRERDGSRWIAVFPVSRRWRRVVLAPSDFRFWQSVKTRGHAGDEFNPVNAIQLVLGAAFTHTGPRAGKYEFVIDEIGTAPSPGGLSAPEFLGPPVIENLCPSYKFYILSDVAKVVGPIFGSTSDEGTPLPSRIFAHHPRPTGTGYGKGRSWRWIPVLQAWGPKDEWRGAPASLYLDFATSSVRLAVGVDDVSWFRHSNVRQSLGWTIDRMARGIFLQEAGAEFYTCRVGQKIEGGARVANLSRHARKALTVRFVAGPEAFRGLARGVLAAIETKPFDVQAGEAVSLKRPTPLPRGREGQDRFLLSVSLIDAERFQFIDGVGHEVAVYRPEPEKERRFMTARDGDFWLDGKKWYAHGVNYMPSTGIGINDWDYFEHWLGKRAYDPEFVQRDLERIKAMGLNCVSIFIYHQSVKSNNLLDILRRCQKLGLMVNLSLRPGTPMSYRWEQWQEIIRHYRLWEQDVIFAYDIAWEPFFGSEAERRRYDPQWRAWLKRKYGSPAAAEKAWGMAGPRHEAQLSCPSGQQLTRDGPHRKMVADYRAFADAIIHEHYQAAYEKIKALDPNHLISFRMTVTGDPTYNWDARMPYDFKSVARSMDFMAPEGYGRIGDWERVKPGRFTVTYARHCAPGKPVLWAEAGVSVWNRDTMSADPERLAFQGRYYGDLYKMVLQSHSNGVIWWWYPGGFRVGENSDFGIIHPDGTDRPVTKVIRQFAPKVLAERTVPQPDVWIEIDRDADARGLCGIYQRVREQYWRAIAAGKTPGLRERER